MVGMLLTFNEDRPSEVPAVLLDADVTLLPIGIVVGHWPNLGKNCRYRPLVMAARNAATVSDVGMTSMPSTRFEQRDELDGDLSAAVGRDGERWMLALFPAPAA
jgi:hypothetical protein